MSSEVLDICKFYFIRNGCKKRNLAWWAWCSHCDGCGEEHNLNRKECIEE